MGTLILTSAGLKVPSVKEAVVKLLPKPLSALKLAYITTAFKVEENAAFADLDLQVLKALGFQVEEIDIAGQSYDQLKVGLRDKDILYVQGGNTFYLLKRIRESGFGRVVRERLSTGVIYIGVSAGTYVACPTIEMATWKKNKEQYGLTDFSAMSLVPFLISVHYNREKYREALIAGVAKTKYPVRIMTDDQALFVKDGEVTLIGTGEEIKL